MTSYSRFILTSLSLSRLVFETTTTQVLWLRGRFSHLWWWPYSHNYWNW